MGSRVLPLGVVLALALLAGWLLSGANSAPVALVSPPSDQAAPSPNPSVSPLPKPGIVRTPGDGVAAPQRAAATQAPEESAQPAPVTETIVWRPATLEVLVRSSSGEPIPGVCFALYRDEDSVGVESTDRNGRLTFTKRSSGIHRLEVSHRGYQQTIGFEYAADVRLEGGTTTTQMVTLPQPGKITFEFGPAIPKWFKPATISIRSAERRGGVIEVKDGLPVTLSTIAPGRYEAHIRGTQRKPHYRGTWSSNRGSGSDEVTRTIVYHLTATFDVRPGESAPARFALPGGRVALRILPNPVDRMPRSVHLLPWSPDPQRGGSVWAYPDDDGVLIVIGAPAGRYVVFTGHPRTGARAEIQISGNNEQILVELKRD